MKVGLFIPSWGGPRRSKSDISFGIPSVFLLGSRDVRYPIAKARGFPALTFPRGEDSESRASYEAALHAALGACLGISIQVTSMDDQSVQIASIRPQCSFAPIPAA